jgi:hypothetical protein
MDKALEFRVQMFWFLRGCPGFKFISENKLSWPRVLLFDSVPPWKCLSNTLNKDTSILLYYSLSFQSLFAI